MLDTVGNKAEFTSDDTVLIPQRKDIDTLRKLGEEILKLSVAHHNTKFLRNYRSHSVRVQARQCIRTAHGNVLAQIMQDSILRSKTKAS